MYTYLTIYENGFALSKQPEELYHIMQMHRHINIYPYADVTEAYKNGCREHVNTRLRYPDIQMPVLPTLEAMKVNPVYHDPNQISLFYKHRTRYFLLYNEGCFGIFTHLNPCISFFRAYPLSWCQEHDTFEKSLFYLNRNFLMNIYPMSAYIQNDRLPIITDNVAPNTVYENPYIKWMKENCHILDSPYAKTLPGKEKLPTT